MSGTELVSETLMIRNMVSNCCVVLLRERLEAAGIIVNQVQLGQVIVSYDPVHHNHNAVAELIREIGLDVIEGREMIMVEKTKQAVIELIHHMNNVDSVVRKSDYLVEKLGYSFPAISVNQLVFCSDSHFYMS